MLISVCSMWRFFEQISLSPHALNWNLLGVKRITRVGRHSGLPHRLLGFVSLCILSIIQLIRIINFYFLYYQNIIYFCLKSRLHWSVIMPIVLIILMNDFMMICGCLGSFHYWILEIIDFIVAVYRLLDLIYILYVSL